MNASERERGNECVCACACVCLSTCTGHPPRQKSLKSRALCEYRAYSWQYRVHLLKYKAHLLKCRAHLYMYMCVCQPAPVIHHGRN